MMFTIPKCTIQYAVFSTKYKYIHSVAHLSALSGSRTFHHPQRRPYTH